MSPGGATAETDTELPSPLRGCGSETADFSGVETPGYSPTSLRD